MQHVAIRALFLAIAAAATAGGAALIARPIDPALFPARILAAHNTERARAGAAPVAWDPLLANGAAQYAAVIAATGNFTHSTKAIRPGIGENLWMGTRGYYSVEAAIAAWIGERRYFIPGIFPANSTTGDWMAVSHYTQIIWPTTTRIGCAMASNRGADYLVCRYSPKGNMDGRPVGYALPERR